MAVFFLKKISSDFQQYGWKNSILRFVKLLARQIGFRKETFYYLKCELNTITEDTELKLPDGFEVRQLSLHDFKIAENHPFFSEKKLITISERFKTEGYYAFGIFKASEFCYLTWVSLNRNEFPYGITQPIALEANEAVLLDSFCFESYRGLGLHSTMNHFRLSFMKQKGKEKGIAVVLKENIPAFKTQISSGFTSYYTISHRLYLNKDFTTIKSHNGANL